MKIEAQDHIRVLVVEDDEDDFLLTRELLRDIDPERFELEWAASFEEAREAMTRRAHDLYLVDYRLGAQTGLELLRAINADALPGPVVILTGHGDREVDLDAMQAGAVDYLTKGQLDPALLERSIRYAIRQKRTEEALRLAVRERDEVLGIVTHDLRNPLNAVRMGIEILAEAGSQDGDAARVAAYLEIVSRAVEQMDRLIEDLVDVARMESGGLSLQLRAQPVGRLIYDAIAGFQPAAADKSIDLQVHVDQELPLVRVDPDRLTQVLANLLSNAVKFTETGGRVRISAVREEDGVCITVSDTGRGIAPEDLGHIFDRYWQARSSRRAGAGLGLSIARGIVDAHGGRIWAESRLGQGSDFHIFLPSAPPEAEDG